MTWLDVMQANIVRGLPAEKVEYRFLHFEDRAQMRSFVRRARRFVRDARWQRENFGPRAVGAGRRRMAEPVLNLAFTRSGLELLTGAGSYRPADEIRNARSPLGIPLPRTSDAFAARWPVPERLVAACEGLTGSRELTNSMFQRLDLLGEAHAARDWSPDWLAAEIHVLAFVSGPADTAIGRLGVLRGYEACVIPGLSITGRRLPDDLDHFGFVDGVGQPAIEGVHTDAECVGRGAWENGQWRPLRAGEIVVGERDESGEIRQPGPHEVLQHATFLVFRQIEMFRDKFDAFLANQLPERSGEIASWLMGRYRKGQLVAGRRNSGTSLMIEGPEEDLDFIYGYDPEGLRCPLGAHVRRANPRDGVGGGGPRVNRHRIIRRGMPYEDGGRTGLAFLAMQARIEDQFEFIQSRWLNTGPTLGIGNDPDPFAGIPASDVSPRFVRQGSPVTVLPLPSRDNRFTIVRGGEYFVMPTVRALEQLAP